MGCKAIVTTDPSASPQIPAAGSIEDGVASPGVGDGNGSVAGAAGSITPQAIDAARSSNPPAAIFRPVGVGSKREIKARGRRTPSPALLVEGILATLREGRGLFREGGPWTLEAKDGSPK